MMKSADWCRRFLVAVVLFALPGWTGNAEAAPILSFGCDVDCSVVTQNSTFDLVIRISDVPDFITSFSFALTFQPSVLRVNSVADITYGGFLGTLGDTDSFGALCEESDPNVLCGSPILINAFVSASPGGINSGDLARIQFDAWGAGPAGLGFVFNSCDPDDTACQSFNPLFFNDRGERIDVTLGEGGVFVESAVPVPEPGTIGLLSLGLMGVARRLRNQRQRKSSASTT